MGNTIFWVVCYIEITKENKEDNADYTNIKVLIANIHQALKKTYTIIKYIKWDITIYHTNCC